MIKRSLVKIQTTIENQFKITATSEAISTIESAIAEFTMDETGKTPDEIDMAEADIAKDADNVCTLLVHCSSKLKLMKSSLVENNSRDSNLNSKINLSTFSVAQSELPKIKIPEFDGNFSNLKHFSKIWYRIT